MATVLIVSNIRVFDHSGIATGPGLRAWGIARSLAERGHRTVLGEPLHGHPPVARADREGVTLAWWTPGGSDIEPLIREADVVVVQPAYEIALAMLDLVPRCLVADLYNPVVSEHLASPAAPEMAIHHFALMLGWYRYFLNRADYFMCAGERQRQFTLGALAHAGRLNPLTCPDELLRLVPMGADSAPSPTLPDKPLLRGVCVPADAELLLWPGGIYGWFEAVTAIRALSLLRKSHPKAALVFVGAENPLEPSASRAGVAAARAAAEELGLLDAGVYFAPWQPYAARAAIYQEADLAVITHRPLLEAHLSWRTRSLDCLWGGLPLVVSTGDEIGEIAEREGAALCVTPEDPQALAAALAALLADPARREAMSAEARRLTTERWSWQNVTEPLHQICLDPRPAPDREIALQRLGVGEAARPVVPPPPPTLARRIRRSVQWRMSRLAAALTGG